MGVPLVRLFVMKPSASRDPSRIPRSVHSLQRTALAAVAAMVLIPVVVLAVAYPVSAAAAVGAALATWPLVVGFRRIRRRRQRRRRSRRVCVPKAGICAEP
jgi:membrane associated rhomboid family serine protease